MTDWFRSWHGAPTDPKWILIAKLASVTPAAVSAVAWALFDHASQSTPRGSISTFDGEAYEAWGGLEDGSVGRVVTAMKGRGIIGENLCLANWAKRQPKREDPSTERVRAWRESKGMKRNVTHGNARNAMKQSARVGEQFNGAGGHSVTAQIGEESQLDTSMQRNVTQCNAREETEKKERKSTPPPLFGGLTIEAKAEEFYRSFPKHVDPALAAKTFIKIVKAGANPDRIIAAAKRYAEAHRSAGTDKQFIKAPSAWLNAGGYDSEDLPDARPSTPPLLRAL